VKKLTFDLAVADGELVESYIAAASQNGAALDAGDYRTANRHHDIGVAVAKEIMRRGAALEGSLLELLKHADPWVRFWAAGDVRRFAPAEAERVLADLAELPASMVRLSAETLLTEWRRGGEART
jgi:hypothetical protein